MNHHQSSDVDVCINLKHKVNIDTCVVARGKGSEVLEEHWGLLWAGEGLAEEVALEPGTKEEIRSGFR